MPTPLEAITGVANACQALPLVLTGGQPTVRHLEALRAAGVDIILDVRDPLEPRPLDEPEQARRLGLEYVNLPVTAGRLDDGLLERILTVLREASSNGKQVFFHCGSGNRVGGALIPFFMIDHGMEEEDAVNQAMRVGLRSAELMEWGLDYVRRSKK
jgi:protein tyrosine phosphatase (PTP) superfamily phosphohydrolase (DUF442 family)